MGASLVSAQRRLGPLPARSSKRLRVKADRLQVELRRELGIDREQLELAMPASTPNGSALARVPNTSTPARPEPCPECGRWGYHLKRCRSSR